MLFRKFYLSRISFCILSIFVLGIVLRIVFFCLNDENLAPFNSNELGSSDEPWSHIQMTTQWINDGQSPHYEFGILDQLWICGLYILDKDFLVFYTRLIPLIAGILLLFVFLFLLKELYGTHIACYGTFLLSIYPLHIHISSVSLAEGPASLMLISSLYFLIKYLKRKNMHDFVFSLITLNISAMLRFECWIFVLIFPIVLFWYYRVSFISLLYFICACVWPLVHMFFSWKYTGDPFIAFVNSQQVTQTYLAFMPSIVQIIDVWKSQLLTLSLPIFSLCAIGIFISLRKPFLQQTCILIYVLYVGILIIRSIQGTYDFIDLRYSLFPGLLFLIFGGVGIDYLIRKQKGVKKMLLSTGLIMLCLFFSLKTVYAFYSECYVPDSTNAVVEWMRTHVKDETVCIFPVRYHPYLVLNSGIPYDHVISNNHAIMSDIELFKQIKRGSYIIIDQKTFFPLRMACQYYNITKVFECGNYCILQKN